jgi:hypothetical protein
MASMMKAVLAYVEPYLARAGGPIILTQIENEYGGFNEYVEWCGNLTKELNSDTVWIMCKQQTPPAPLIGACNGGDCSYYVQAQQAAGLPAMWTEDWIAWFQHCQHHTHTHTHTHSHMTHPLQGADLQH